MSDIETELLKVTKHRRQGRDEDRGEYLTRLWDAAESLKDEDWKLLSDPAGNWVNDVTTAYRSYKKDKGSGDGFEPADFSTVEKAFAIKKEKEWAEQFARDKTAEAEEEEREALEKLADKSTEPPEEGNTDALEEEPRKRRGRPPNVEVKGNDRSEPAVEPKEVVTKETERGFNLQSAVRRLMMKEPNMPLDKIHASIQEQVGAPVTLSTIQTSRASFRSALKELHAAGHLKGIDPEGLV